MNAQEALKTFFGYESFRPMQYEIIESVLQGRDTLALLPTGGGKSLCFQIPAIVKEGLCLVITPLIALMRDQVGQLKQRGIQAAAIYTGMSWDEQRTAMDNCRFGPYRCLYISPERLQSEAFRKQLLTLPICLIAVDEAHCISQWGYDFRPAYLQIGALRQTDAWSEVPILALTATATPTVADDIQEQLHFRERNILQTSFVRPNLSYIVRYTDDKQAQIVHILNRVEGSAIVYVRNRLRCKQLSEWLNMQLGDGVSTYYHAGLTSMERTTRQQAWTSGRTRVMVATNAFGMGIDKPDVRIVIHHDMPDSIEAYFQEAGRAGRDEKRAFAVLLYHPSDKATVIQRIPNNFPEPEFVDRVYQTLCNYLTIGLGSGLDHNFALDFNQFCSDAHLAFMPTYSALQLLTQAGYIIYQDEEDVRPRTQIIVRKEELYNLSETPFQERLLTLMMRRYTGIFADPIYINLSRLAEDLQSNEFAINQSLVAMAKRRIIKYIPAHRISHVYFPLERQEDVYLKPEIYLLRKETYEHRLTAMIDYAENLQFCRSQVLLGYFGEITVSPCERCDVCLAHKKEL